MLATETKRGPLEPLTSAQMYGLKRIYRMRVLPPWEEELRQLATLLSDMGYLTMAAAHSDNVKGAGNFVRIRLTLGGYRAMGRPPGGY